jgi:PTS system galactitol-specific IIA component
MSNCFSKDLILIDLKAASAGEVIRALSGRLEEHGYVKPSFCDAVIEREKVFATGLPVEPMGVAIPHTDAEHVNQMAIALAVLSSPVKFGLMGSEGEIDVDLVFLMALDNCASQISMLQSLAEFVHKDGLVERIRTLRDKQAILEILEKEISLKPQADCEQSIRE